MTLDDVRKEIDTIDKDLTDLIVRRMEASKMVAQAKIDAGLPIFNGEREKVVIESAVERSGEYADVAKNIFASLIDMSKALQHKMIDTDKTQSFTDSLLAAKKDINMPKTIACQGAKGAYSHRAARNFCPDAEVNFYKSFEDVINAVETGKEEFGVLPIENSSAGSVIEVYDLLCNHRFYIAKAVEVSVDNCLIGIKGVKKEDIKCVYSHPQALRQCSDFLSENGIEPREDVNTAIAAKRIAELEDKTIGVVASGEAAAEYGLEILERDINNCENNRTRFILISKDMIITDDADKISLSFIIEHTTGSLYRILSRFVESGLNLTKIESRPVRSGEFEYRFYLDFTGNIHDKATLELISSLSCELSEFVFFGNYHESENAKKYEKMLDKPRGLCYYDLALKN